jgi:hypothetical protein
MDWKSEFKASVDRQLITEGPLTDFVFGTRRGNLYNKGKYIGPVSQTPLPKETAAPAAPKPDPFAEIKAHSAEANGAIVDHVRDTLLMARQADSKSYRGKYDTGVSDYSYDSINQDYSVSGDHGAHKLAQHLGAALISAHTGLPSQTPEGDHYLSHVELDDDNKVVAHYKYNEGRYPKTTFKKIVG